MNTVWVLEMRGWNLWHPVSCDVKRCHVLSERNERQIDNPDDVFRVVRYTRPAGTEPTP